MKKIYGFLTAAAILLTAACTQDLEGPNKVDEVKGDFYMTMNITPTGNAGTRAEGPDTQTGREGVEIGKDYENAITTALIIFATPVMNQGEIVDYNVFQAVSVGGGDHKIVPGSNNTNLAVFEVNRKTIQEFITTKDQTSPAGQKKVEFSIFVVANPPTDLKGKLNPTTDGGSTTYKSLYQTFTLETDGNTYWSANNFLMSNKEEVTKEISEEDVATGTHTTESNALPLGTVKVQRAMSRFDIMLNDIETPEPDKKYQKFTIANSNEKYNVTIELDAVALVNQATVANLFKVTDTYADGYFTTKKFKFTDETATNYVISPEQSNFTLPFFGDGTTTGGLLNGEKNVDYSTLFAEGGSSKSLSAINDDDNIFTYPNSSPANQGNYKIWRYCMENTNASTEAMTETADPNSNQKNGNSTGVVFRAIMTGNTFGQATEVYAYNSVILGTFEQLHSYIVNEKQPETVPNDGPDSEQNPTKPNDQADPGVYEMVQIQWAAAIKAYNASNGERQYVDTDATDGESRPATKLNWKTLQGEGLTTLAQDLHNYLVAQNFTIYKRNSPTDNFYCYYIYWNRHNNNGDETLMGPMEFATVRNNVYKLRVTGINKLGHPGDPNDDPDPNKPDDPDEKDHLYMNVECKVLPWEVRINDIIF